MKEVIEQINKVVTFYESLDGILFDSKEECVEHESNIGIQNLHNKLIECDFHQRFSIEPYFHNVLIENLGKRVQKELDDRNSFRLMSGRMGNGDCRVRYKKRNKNIILLRYNTDNFEQEHYLGKLPIEWLDMDLTSLNVAVNDYFEKLNSKKERSIRVKDEEVFEKTNIRANMSSDKKISLANSEIKLMTDKIKILKAFIKRETKND